MASIGSRHQNPKRAAEMPHLLEQLGHLGFLDIAARDHHDPDRHQIRKQLPIGFPEKPPGPVADHCVLMKTTTGDDGEFADAIARLGDTDHAKPANRLPAPDPHIGQGGGSAQTVRLPEGFFTRAGAAN